MLELRQPSAEQEREQELVLLEEGPADVGVERVEEEIFEVLESEGEVGRFIGFGDGLREEVDVVHE